MKKCPFCGSKETSTKGNYLELFYVECKQCRSKGMPSKTPKEAENNWNKRISRKPEICAFVVLGTLLVAVSILYLITL